MKVLVSRQNAKEISLLFISCAFVNATIFSSAIMGGVSEENQTQSQLSQSTNAEIKTQETKTEAPVKVLPLYISAVDRVSFDRVPNDTNRLHAAVLFGVNSDLPIESSALVAQIQYRLPNPQQPSIRLIDVDLGLREIQKPKTPQLVRQQFCVNIPLDDPNLKEGTTDAKANSVQSVPILTSDASQRPAFNTFKVQFKLSNNSNPNVNAPINAFPSSVKDLITTCDRAADSVATEVENALQTAAKVFDRIPTLASSWLNRFEQFMDELDKDLKANKSQQPVTVITAQSTVNTQPQFVPIQSQPLNPYGQYYQSGINQVDKPAQTQTQPEPPKATVQPNQSDPNQNSAFSISD